MLHHTKDLKHKPENDKVKKKVQPELKDNCEQQRICGVKQRKQLLEATNNNLSRALWMSRKLSLLSAGNSCNVPRKLQY